MDPGARRSIWPRVVVGLLAAVTSAMSLALQPEAGAVAAPVLGPWAGLALGHSDCTIGNQVPGPSLALAALGVALAVGLARVTRPGARLTLVSLGLAWFAAWELAALASVLNTTS